MKRPFLMGLYPEKEHFTLILTLRYGPISTTCVAACVKAYALSCRYRLLRYMGCWFVVYMSEKWVHNNCFPIVQVAFNSSSLPLCLSYVCEKRHIYGNITRKRVISDEGIITCSSEMVVVVLVVDNVIIL